MLGNVSIYVPGSSEKKITKAAKLDVDSIVLDLEDAVGFDDKAAARGVLKEMTDRLDFGKRYIVLRINSLDSIYWQDDLALAINLPIDAILIPKAKAADIIAISNILDSAGSPAKLIALIESASSVENAPEIICASKRLIGIFFGGEDYTADMGVRRTDKGDEILYARMRIGNAARAYDVEAIDTPYTSITDHDGLALDTIKAKQLGFTGKSIIHPSHIDTVKQAFLPTEAEIEYAKRLLSAIGPNDAKGANTFAFEGKMIDAPIIKRAKQVLKNHRKGGTQYNFEF